MGLDGFFCQRGTALGITYGGNDVKLKLMSGQSEQKVIETAARLDVDIAK